MNEGMKAGPGGGAAPERTIPMRDAGASMLLDAMRSVADAQVTLLHIARTMLDPTKADAIFEPHHARQFRIAENELKTALDQVGDAAMFFAKSTPARAP